MEQTEKVEKKVEVKEKPLGETKIEEKTVVQASEQPDAAAQPGRAESMASKGGEAIGAGLKKVAGVIGEFTAGISKEMKAGEPQKPGEQQAQVEEQSERIEQAKEPSQVSVTKEERTEKKEIRKTE